MTLRETPALLKEAGKKFLADDAPRLGAALAFYTALSLSPLLLAVVALAGFIFGEQAARGELVEQLRDTIGQEAATVVEQLVAKSAAGSGGVIATVAALAIVVFGASRVFTELQGALNAIWKVPGRKPERRHLELDEGPAALGLARVRDGIPPDRLARGERAPLRRQRDRHRLAAGNGPPRAGRSTSC